MKTKTCSHTPGPWHTKGTVVLISPRLVIAEADRCNKNPNTATANARLIAAAPQMLAALQSISDDCLEGLTGVLQSDTSAMLRAILGTAQDAISDATGK